MAPMYTLLLPLLLACGKDAGDSDPGGTSAPVDSETTPADDSADSDGTDDTSTTDDTAPPTPSEFDRAEVNETTWAQVGYVVEEWVDNTGVLGADGVAPSLTWIRPAEDRPVDGIVLYLHGSTAADDSAEPCDTEVAEIARERFLIGWGTAVYHATRNNLAVLAPVNRWCDVWLGLGPDDPVDTNHHGYSFLSRSLDWALSPSSGVDIDGPVVAWGTSTGAIGAGLAAARRDEVIAAVVDSGPIDLEDRTQFDFAATLVHILGGGPEAVPERYRENSVVALIEDGVLTKPIFGATNNQDDITAAVHGEELLAALEAAYDPAGLRYGWHDFNHPAPGDTHHVQTGLRPMPWTYVTPLLMSFFFDDARLQWSEAEADCDRCEVGALIAVGTWAETASGGAVMGALESDGPGVALSVIPPEAASGGPVTGTAVLGLGTLSTPIDPATLAATVRWTVDGEIVASQTLTFGELDDGNDLRAAAEHVEKSTLALPGTYAAGSDTRFEVHAAGGGPLLIDAAVFSWGP